MHESALEQREVVNISSALRQWHESSADHAARCGNMFMFLNDVCALCNNALAPVFHTGIYWNSAAPCFLVFIKGIHLVECKVDMGNKQLLIQIPDTSILSSWSESWFIFWETALIWSLMGFNCHGVDVWSWDMLGAYAHGCLMQVTDNECLLIQLTPIENHFKTHSYTSEEYHIECN